MAGVAFSDVGVVAELEVIPDRSLAFRSVQQLLGVVVHEVQRSVDNAFFPLLDEAAVFQPGGDVFGDNAAHDNNRQPELHREPEY